MTSSALKMYYSATHREFYNKHLQGSCVILGGGHSVKYMDLKNFEGKTIIGVNLLPFHIDFKNLNVQYNIITQPRIFVPWILKREMDREFHTVAELYKKLSALSAPTYFVHQWAKIFNPRIVNWWPVPNHIWDPDKRIKALGAFGGAFYSSLSLARLMGFTDITMVGFDAFTLKKHSHQRWFEFGHGSHSTDVDPKAVMFLKYLISTGIKLRTVGIETSALVKELEYHEYGDLFSSPPNYKENQDLLLPEAYLALQTYKYLKMK